jgi:hypothetical protein
MNPLRNLSRKRTMCNTQGKILRFIFATVCILATMSIMTKQTAFSQTTALATNFSNPTMCAEEDNINIPLTGNVKSFIIEAMHPAYNIMTYSCSENFNNCILPIFPSYPFNNPGTFKLFDDGFTVIDAVREAFWWRPTGMSVSVNSGYPESDIHYLRVYKKVFNELSWPQVLIIYQDGNIRAVPHPPMGTTSVCFGTSVIVGPAANAYRPFAEISLINYIPTSDALEVQYKAGWLATLNILTVDRTVTRIKAAINFPNTTLPFCTVRSMYVADGNADVDHVRWKDISTAVHSDPIMTFPGGVGGEWLFYRQTPSYHNMSGPDIKIVIERSPVYRFFNTVAGGHFFTIDEAEKNTVIQNYKWFRYEGIGFYTYPVQQLGTLPVYRFFNMNAGGHFFTIDEAEKNTVIQNYKWFRPEGVGFYAYPSS